jgi:ribonuclease PH
MTEGGKLIEIQGTAEKAPFDRDELNGLLDLGQSGIQSLIAMQRQAVAAG